MRCNCHSRCAPIPPEMIAAFIAGAIVAMLIPPWLLLVALIAVAAFAVWRLLSACSCRCCR